MLPPWCPELGFGKKAQNAEAQPAQPEQHCLPGWASHNSGHFDFQKKLKKNSNRKPTANKGNKADFWYFSGLRGQDPLGVRNFEAQTSFGNVLVALGFDVFAQLKTSEPSQIWGKNDWASTFQCCPPWFPKLGFGKKAKNVGAQSHLGQECLGFHVSVPPPWCPKLGFSKKSQNAEP